MNLRQVARLRLLADSVAATRVVAESSQLLPVFVRVFVMQRARAVVPHDGHEGLLRGFVPIKVSSRAALARIHQVAADLVVLAGAGAFRRQEQSHAHCLALGRLRIVHADDLLRPLVSVVGWALLLALLLRDLIYEARLVHFVPLVAPRRELFRKIERLLSLVIRRSWAAPARLLRIVNDFGQKRRFGLSRLTKTTRLVQVRCHGVGQFVPGCSAVVLRFRTRFDHILHLDLTVNVFLGLFERVVQQLRWQNPIAISEALHRHSATVYDVCADRVESSVFLAVLGRRTLQQIHRCVHYVAAVYLAQPRRSR